MEFIGRFSGFDADLKALEVQVCKSLLQAGRALQADAKACLQEHIEADVYSEFEPFAYVRRGGNGGLADVEQNSTAPSPTATPNGVEIQLVYTPDGRTDGDGNAIEPHVDGDALINRIEKSDPDYNWNRMRRPENRPFFRNFVEEMIEGQRAENTLVAAMNAANPTLGLAADGNIIRENEEMSKTGRRSSPQTRQMGIERA